MATFYRVFILLALFHVILFNCVLCSKVDYEDNYADLILSAVPHSPRVPEDALLNVYNITKKYGYELESYRVVTKDGYILGLYRLFNGRAKKNGEVVYLMHGWMGSSDDWITPGLGKSPAFILADLGYDVWLGNARGNKHSLKHSKLRFRDLKFWDFTADHIALIDLKTLIDYVLMNTKKSKIYYVGLSQGTVVINMLLSRIYKYNDRFKLVVELAPVAWLKNLKSPALLSVLALNPYILAFSKHSGIGDIYLSAGILISSIFKMLCYKSSPLLNFCYLALQLLDGADPQDLDPDTITTFFSHTLVGCSAKQVDHFTQIYRTGEFKSYDYGPKKNFKIYGKNSPPYYITQNFTAPVMLAYGLNDQIGDPADVKKLYKTLPNVVDYYQIPRSKFNHIDFALGNDFKRLVMDRVVKTMKKYA